ncbi:MAG: SUMF1/EgtB/PvdO family nonheme iron enzyme [Pirellulales bacterium]
MTQNHDPSLGDQETRERVGQPVEPVDRSLGDQSTHGDREASSLGGLSGIIVAHDGPIDVVDLAARYVIEGPVGQGGMGEVLLATDTRLKRKVAIKRVRGAMATNQAALARFATEAQAIAALSHPHIVQIYDYGRDQDGPFLIMEYVDGGSLLDRCQTGPIPLEQAIDLTCQLCDGLAKAHDAGIIHRDIKPANILLTQDGTAKLTDFGLAKAESTDTSMTMAGALLGTLDFMPPEQRRDASLVDARSDLWSLGATLYQMLTGKSPKVIRLHELPKSLQSVLSKALEDRQEARYQSAQEFREALRNSHMTAYDFSGAMIPPAGECPKCRTRNEASRKFCRECAASLRVNCLQCGEGILAWEKICGECGGNQADLVSSRIGELLTECRRAEALRSEHAYDDAISIVEPIESLADERFAQIRTWATDFLSSTNAERDRQLQLAQQHYSDAQRHRDAVDYLAAIYEMQKIPVPLRSTEMVAYLQQLESERVAESDRQLFAEAKRHRKRFDYQSAIQAIKQIPPSRRSRTVAAYLIRLQFDQAEAQQTLKKIEEKISQRDQVGLRKLVARALTLCGDDDGLRDLLTQLDDEAFQKARTRAESFRAKYEYEDALIVARKVATKAGGSISHHREWAEEFLTSTKLEWEQQRKSASQRFELARRYREECDLQAAVQELERISPALRTKDMLAFLDQLQLDCKNNNKLHDARTLAESHRTQHAYEAAMNVAQSVVTAAGDLFRHHREWAEEFLSSTKAEWEQQRESASQRFELARKYREECDLQAAVQELERIPPPLRTKDMAACLDQLQTEQAEAEQLVRIIGEQVSQGKQHGLRQLVVRALQLLGNKSDLCELLTRLDHEELHQARTRAESLRAKHAFKAALSIARKVANKAGDQFRWHREWAEAFLSSTTAEWEQQKESALQRFELARKYREECDLQAAVQELEQIPAGLRTKDMVACLNQLQTDQAEAERLLREIRAQVAEGRQVGLRSLVVRALKLVGDRSDLLELLTKLDAEEIQRDRTQAESLRAQHAYDAAIYVALRIASTAGDQFREHREWAEAFLSSKAAEWEQQRESALQRFELAPKFREVCDLQAAVQELERIPVEMRSEPIDANLAQLRIEHADATNLSRAIEQQFSQANRVGQLELETVNVKDRTSLRAANFRRALLVGSTIAAITFTAVTSVFLIRSTQRASAVSRAIRQGRWDDALAIDPSSTQALLGRAKQRLDGSASDLHEAIADLNRVAELDPNNRQLADLRALVVAWESRLDGSKASQQSNGQQLPTQEKQEIKTHSESTPPAQMSPQQLLQQRPLVNSIGMQLKLLPAGTFMMGSARPGSRDTPRHVTLTQPFYLGVTEVTQEQFKRVMGSNPSISVRAQNPVENVTWEDAVEFCRRLSELPEESKARRMYRLPTEAEWEYACRAGTTTEYFFGDSGADLDLYAWYEGNSGKMAHPVCQKQPNPWGLYDMHGNVWEWCHDWHGYLSSSETDPTGPPSGMERVLRGGSWINPAASCRSTLRYSRAPIRRGPLDGFRIALTPSSDSAYLMQEQPK